MKAIRIFYDRTDYPDGAILEMTLWVVPEPVPGSVPRLKYSLFCGYAGQRLVGYDNEPGKGDHRHLGEVETPYTFLSPESLIRDFMTDVAKMRDAL